MADSNHTLADSGFLGPEEQRFPRIPDHEVIKSLGCGGCKEVWLARTIIEEYRAVGVVSRKTLKQFEKEFAGIRKFGPISRTHEGFVHILQVGKTAQGDLYYIMQLADDQVAGQNIVPNSYVAKTLRVEIRNRRRFPADECLQVGLSLAAALEHLHKHGLIHRDIKPDNILYVDGRPKLGDIGLVAAIGQPSFVGTPGYIPPEGPGSPQADIYSLGKVLYEMSTGEDREQFPEWLSDPTVTADSEKLLGLNKIIRKACENDTRKRYQATTEMHADLTRLQQGKAIVIAEDSKSVPNNLPAQLTSFIGREREMAEVKRLLKTTRLLTLTGIGGSGKTRLALQVGTNLLGEYADGVWLVELAALSDPGLVPQAVATVLDVREEPNRPLMSALSDRLRSKHVLLLLDNCEHLISACAQLADDLLKVCPKLRVLATSREGFGIGGELIQQVPSLSTPASKPLPSLEQLTEYEAVRLFVERIVAVQPDFVVTSENAAAVAQICRRLDGIPLAIELAAPRVRMLTVEQIAERLDGSFRLLTGGSRTALPRQQTLQATMDWSYGLLSEPEQKLLRRLSVFAGGFTLEAATAVYEDDALDLLARLVDKSLVVAEHHGHATRYRLLETIRQYGRDKLLESGESNAVYTRHRDFFLELAERAELSSKGPEEIASLGRLEAEHDNLSAALAWALETNPMTGLKLAEALAWFWEVRGFILEGRDWLERELAQVAQPSADVRARALEPIVWFAWRQGDTERAFTALKECLSPNRRSDNVREIAAGRGSFGLPKWIQLSRLEPGCGGAMWSQDDYEQAKCEETIWPKEWPKRKPGDKRGAAGSLCWLGTLAGCCGDYWRARALFEESLTIFRELNDQRGTARLLFSLGWVSGALRDYAQACDYFGRSLAIFKRLGYKALVGASLSSLGNVSRAQGDYERAAAYHAEGLAVAKELGFRWGIAFTLEGLADVAGALSQPLRAAKLAGSAEALRDTINLPVTPSNRADYDRAVATVRAALSEENFSAAWAAGRAMTMEQAIAYALEQVPAA